MKSSTRATMMVIVVVLFACAVFLQAKIDPERHQFEPKLANVNSAVAQLPIEFALGAATGFREAIAGLLWVRTDEFFHSGNYDAIVPMVRIITWLDPHNIDVYETGAWHMDYNFTDADQRSDRRYIPLSLSLLKEGIANNPTDSSLFADLAFTHYMRKVEDYPLAVYWYAQGEKLRAAQGDSWNITTVGHGLAHAYEACGQIDNAIAQWKTVIAEHEHRLADVGSDYAETNSLHIAERNLNEIELRRKHRAIDTKPPLDADFDVTATRIAPMIFVISGHAHFIGSQHYVLETGEHTWTVGDGTRIELRLQDYNYKFPENQPFTLNANIDPHATIMQDTVSVEEGTFHKRIDMSRDHLGADPMYSFTAPKYTLTCWFNPASYFDNPPNVQDRTGWLGEGMTDKRYLDTSGIVPGTPGDKIDGLRMLKKTFVLTRDDIMGSGLKVFH